MSATIKNIADFKARQQSAAIELVAFCLARQVRDEFPLKNEEPFEVTEWDRNLAKAYIEEFYKNDARRTRRFSTVPRSHK